jgi:hypothetical protein
LGAELFGSEDLARELLPKLLDSYVVDYVLLGDSNSTRGGKSDNRAAIDFFELLCRSGSQRASAAGSGAGISTRQGGLLGDGVSLDDTLVHYGVQFADGKGAKPAPRRRPTIIYPRQQNEMNEPALNNAVQQQQPQQQR